MSEVENDDVMQEIAQEIVNPTAEETQSEQSGVSSQQSERESRNDRNWRELRRQKEDWERKSKMQDEMMQRVLSQQSMASSAKNESPEEDFLQDIAREEYVPGEKVAKGFKKLEEKFDKRVQDLESRYQQKHQNSMLSDLKREYPDFDSIVNSETLDLLEETNPRLAATIAQNKDAYSIAVQSYEYIKAKGLANPVSRRASETDKKIEQNKKTVASPQVFDKRPMAQAFQLTDSMKKELQKEMYGYAQQAGMGY